MITKINKRLTVMILIIIKNKSVILNKTITITLAS